MSLIRNLIFFLLTPLLFVNCITANHHLDDDGCSIYYENGVHKIDFGYGEEDYLVRDSADVVFLDSVFSFNILSKNKPLEANKIPLIGLDEYKYKKNTEIVLEKTGKSNQVYYFISEANNEVHGVDINLNEKSFVGVFDRHFYLDSLYNDNLFASHETMEPFISWTCSDFFDFKFSGQHYILFFVSPIVENSSFVESRGILLSITEKNVHVNPFPYYQYSTSTSDSRFRKKSLYDLNF